MRFHSAIATLEPQKYVIAGTVGTENILLVSGGLVTIFIALISNKQFCELDKNLINFYTYHFRNLLPFCVIRF